MATPNSTVSTPPLLANSVSPQGSLDLGAYKKSKEAQKLVSWVGEQYSTMKSARIKLQNLWYLNMAFYYGNQYVELLPRWNKLAVPKAPPYRTRQVANRVRPMIRTEYARVTSQKPNASVVPASSEDEDLAAAYAAEQLWESICQTSKLQQHYNRAAWWMLITGVGFLKTWWDPNVLDSSQVPGSVCFGNVTPFNLFVPDLREVTLQGQPYVLNVYTKPVDWVKKFYGEKIDGKSIVANVVSSNEIMNDAYLNLQGGTKNQPDSVLCQELWVKPGGCEYFPNGGMVQIVSDQVVGYYDQGIPYKHGEFPFTKFDHIPNGRFYSDSVIVDVISLQREYNRTRSQIIEAKNRMAKPQLIAPLGSVNASKITTEPGLLIEYRPGLNPPQPLQLQPLPNYVLQELDRSLIDMEDISGQHQVSRGTVPPGVTAATAISFLQEKDDSLLTHTYQSIEAGFEEIARQTISHVVQYWDIPRTIKVVGTDGYFDVLQLMGTDVESATDIRMEGGSALPVSKAARQAFIMDLMKMGFLDPQDGLKILDVGGVQKLWQRIRRDESQAQRENIKLKRMDPAQATEFTSQWEVLTQSGQSPMVDQQTGQPLA